ncbi:hypothetical protein LTR08_005103 [Meristemomyces frigidus]|nr:hypothetical protein LTR08_005103 [Meristemomyces frigidus]
MELSIRTRSQHGQSESEAKSTTNTPQPNLPLPRELRDHVFGYLVNQQHVRAQPYYTRPKQARGQRSEANDRDRSAAHTYQFHTTIFAVNKQIRKEALEELHRTNIFIVVSWAWPELGRTLNAFDVPIVTDNQSAVARFKHHTLRLHLQNGKSGPRLREAPQMLSLLMLLADFPIFCRTIRYTSSITPMPCTLFLKDVDAPQHELQTFRNVNHVSRPVHSKIQFCSSSARSNTVEMQIRLLASFNHMTIAGQKLTLLGALGDDDTGDEKPMRQAVLRLNKLAGPTEVWVSIVAWGKLATARMLMMAANSLVRKGDLMRAGEHYTRIYSGTLGHGVLCDLPGAVETSDAGPPIIYALRVLTDAAAAAGLLHLRNLDIRSAQEADDYGHGLTAQISRYENREAVLGIPGRAVWLQRSPSFHLGLLLQLAKAEVGLESLVMSFETMSSALPSNQHVAHDLRCAKRLRDRYETNPQVTIKPERILQSTSAIAMPPQTFLYDVPKHVARPQKVFGWIDMDQFDAWTGPDGEEARAAASASAVAAATAAGQGE